MESQRVVVSYPPWYVFLPHLFLSFLFTLLHSRLDNSSNDTGNLRVNTDLSEPERKQITYGPDFKYSEFRVAKSKAGGVLASLGLILGMMSLLIPPFRWLFKKIAPQSGEGPSPEYVSFPAVSVPSWILT